MNLQGVPFQRTGLQRTPAAGSLAGQPCANATPSEAQRLDHNFRALARLDSFHGANSNLFQRLVVKSTSVASYLVVPYVYLSINLLIRRIWPQFADKRRGLVGKVVSEVLNALAEAELEVRQDFAGSKNISPLRCGMPLHSPHEETKKTLTHGIADAF